MIKKCSCGRLGPTTRPYRDAREIHWTCPRCYERQLKTGQRKVQAESKANGNKYRSAFDEILDTEH